MATRSGKKATKKLSKGKKIASTKTLQKKWLPSNFS